MVGWLGALPQSATAIGQMDTAAPFVWGRGGARMTPEEIAFQRRLSADQSQLDYSPLGHWAQGLARVLGNVEGGLRERRADRAAEANAAEGDAVMRALMGSGQGASTQGVTAALLNPYVSDEVRNFARMQWERANAKPQQPTDFQQLLIAGGVQPGSPDWIRQNLNRANSLSDPQVTVSLPGGGIFVGPQSELANVLKGGGPASSGPGDAPPPSTLPPDFDFNEKPMTPTTAAPVLGDAMTTGTITPAQAQAIRSSLGPRGGGAFDAWMRNNNIRIAQ